jgi:hypothetical protein
LTGFRSSGPAHRHRSRARRRRPSRSARIFNASVQRPVQAVLRRPRARDRSEVPAPIGRPAGPPATRSRWTTPSGRCSPTSARSSSRPACMRPPRTGARPTTPTRHWPDGSGAPGPSSRRRWRPCRVRGRRPVRSPARLRQPAAQFVLATRARARRLTRACNVARARREGPARRSRLG